MKFVFACIRRGRIPVEFCIEEFVNMTWCCEHARRLEPRLAGTSQHVSTSQATPTREQKHY
jgi:hypothetical protein